MLKQFLWPSFSALEMKGVDHKNTRRAGKTEALISVIPNLLYELMQLLRRKAMNAVKAQWSKLNERYLSLSRRERGLLAGSLIFVPMLMMNILFRPSTGAH